MRLPDDSAFRLCRTGAGELQPLVLGGESARRLDFLGFEPAGRKFVRVHFVDEESLDPGEKRGWRQRMEQWSALRHPGIVRLFEWGDAPEGGGYLVTELREGEPLAEYLGRHRVLSPELGGILLLQVADVVAHLADHPRLLSLVEMEDFCVTLENGVAPGMCLTEPGVGREERPLGDRQLAERWVRRIAEWHEAMRDGDDRTRLGVGEMIEGATAIDPAYRESLATLAEKSGVDAVLHLKGLGTTIRRAAGFDGEMGARVPDHARCLSHAGLAPVGPLQRLVTASGELDAAIGRDFELRPTARRFSFSPFLLPAARRDTGEEVQLYILPPERLYEEALVERLTRKMFDPYLKSHPNAVRVCFFSCEYDYSLVVGDRFTALPLPSLLARRVRFAPREALALARECDRVLAHFESAEFPVDSWNPWQFELFFEDYDPDNVAALVDSDVKLAAWPPWDLKFRVEQPAEAYVESHHSPWSYLCGRLGGRSFPALLIWLLDGDRFEWALSAGLEEEEPLSWHPRLDSLFRSAGRYFEAGKPEQRERLLSLASAVLLEDEGRCFDDGARFGEGWDFRREIPGERHLSSEERLLRRGLPRSQRAN